MERPNNLSFLDSAAQQLISAKHCSYTTHELCKLCTHLGKEVSKYKNMKCELLQIEDNKNSRFNAFLIKNQTKNLQPCIVYLHGLSSYCFQGQYLLNHISDNYSLCLYDLRAHGKNKRQHISFGIEQASDLYCLITKLHQIGITQLYLWGRSMGASTILQFLSKYGNVPLVQDMLNMVILDSPFCSFQKIAKQTVSQNLGIPGFVCTPFVNMGLKKIMDNYEIDLRSLNFGNLSDVKFKAVFVYSEKDQVVCADHSEDIIKGYGGAYHIVKGSFGHNDPRPLEIVNKIMGYFIAKGSTSRMSIGSNKNMTPKKGLSISLISAKKIPDEKQNHPPLNLSSRKKISSRGQLHEVLSKIEQPSKKQLLHESPRIHFTPLPPKGPSVSFFTPVDLNIKKDESISLSIKRGLTRQNRTKLQTSHKLIEEMSKSKEKNQPAQQRNFQLSNRRYL